MRTHSLAWLGLCLAGFASVAGQAHRPPRFEDFPVIRSYDGEPAPVDLASAPWARRYRTVLRDGAADGPNFAGELTVVEWGCGTSCQQVAVLETRTGRIVGPLLRLTRGADYRLDSRLMVVDPMRPGEGVSRYEPQYVRYFAWTGRRLALMDSMRVAAARP